jgi:hypothetical protein
MLSNRCIPRLIALALCSIAALVFTAFASGAVAHAVTCSPHEIGPDTSLATADAPMTFGHGFGETFVAKDTLIESITVWRNATDDTSFAGFELFIVATDSLGVPDLTRRLYSKTS